MAWFLPLLQFPPVSPLAHRLPSLNPFSLCLPLAFRLCLSLFFAQTLLIMEAQHKFPPFQEVFSDFPVPPLYCPLFPTAPASPLTVALATCLAVFHLCIFPTEVGALPCNKCSAKEQAMTLPPFTSPPPRSSKEEAGLEMLSQVLQDTRSRANAEMRRPGNKLLWSPPPHPREAPARGERALWGECDYEAMNSWHLRKYSTQVVSYTKRTF